MRTRILLFTLCAIWLPITCWGQASLSSLEPSEDPVSQEVAKALLSKAWMHHTSLLEGSKVWLTAAFEIDRTTKKKDGTHAGAVTTAMVCMARHKSLPTEYYLVTVQDNKVVDGAMVGHNGDASLLEMKFHNDEIRYKPDMKIDFEFIRDTVKVKREYRFFSTARGGAWFNKDGTIYNPFVIAKDGTIKQATPIATAMREDGDANYLSENRKPTTYSTATGEFYPLGMKVLQMSQAPACQPLNMEMLNQQAGAMLRIMEECGEDAPESPTTLSVIEFAKWSFNLGMRHSDEFLTWIANNRDTEKFSLFIDAVVSENENKELEWITENVKKLKDGNVRKLWENVLNDY